MESLDDVIDAMIADRVIHRHRRKWLILLAIVLALALLILVLGGWAEKKGRQVDTLQAPTTLEAGRFEFGITKATIVRTPKTANTEAETRVELSLDVRNIDHETRKSSTVPSEFLLLVPPTGGLLKSKWITCRGEIGYPVVYGLRAVPCTAEYDVPVDFEQGEIEFGVLAEEFSSDDELLIADELPYWRNETSIAVVRVAATIETETTK